MRKLVLTLASLAALGLVLPAMSNPAEARDKVIIIKKKVHHDRGLHLGWRHRHHDDWSWRHRHRGHDANARVIIQSR